MIIIKPDIFSHPNLGSFFRPSPNLRSLSQNSHAGPNGIRSLRESDVILATVKKLVCKNSHGTDWNSFKSTVKLFSSWESWEGVLVRLDV